MDIQRLVGNLLTKIGRAADMLWMGMGKEITVASTLKKEQRKVSEFAIHFQCQWRFVQNGKILVASHDIYQPFNAQLIDDKAWKWDIFGREENESSQFDILVTDFNQTLLPLTVVGLKMLDTGDLHINFNKNVSFDTFITYSRKYEFFTALSILRSRSILWFSMRNEYILIYHVSMQRFRGSA